MRIFVTGSTGYIGSAVVRALVKAGHHVGGLYRNPEKESVVQALGATPIFGHLRDPETYQHFAAECDAVVHAGFESPDSEQIVAETLLSALIAEGENKLLVFTSGVWVMGNTGLTPVDETTATLNPLPTVAWRPLLEQHVLTGGNEQIATAVIRPGIVYGGRGGLLSGYFDSATKNNAAMFIGDGRNHIAPIHRDDLAQLYRLIIEKRARGLFHGVDGTHPTVNEVATAFSQAAGKSGRTQSWPLDQARQKMGGWVDGVALDQRVVTKRAAEVGWKLSHPSVVAAAGAAFVEWRESV